MTTTELTCAHLYEVDSTFRALVNVWDSERRCPAPLIDLCIEWGLERAADCCRWAVGEPDRPIFEHIDPKLKGILSGPYPAYDNCSDRPTDDPYWYWMCGPSNICRSEADCVPPENTADSYLRHPTSLNAILWLMDNWTPKEQQ